MIIHELGHLALLKFFNWQVRKVIILPFGGLTLIEEALNRPISEEFLIVLAGPLFQIIGYIFLKHFFLVPNLFFMHIGLLLFNLLPIYPLDGAKIVLLLLEKIFPYKLSHLLILVISYVSLFFLFTFNLSYLRNLIIFLCMLFIFFRLFKESRRHKYYFEKFLLERYLYKFAFFKVKIIRDENKMYRDYRHLFKNGKYYLTEEEYLKKRFDFKP